MAPRSKGAVTINLRDLQRELHIGKELPSAPRGEDDPHPSRDGAPNNKYGGNGGNNKRWADHAEEDADLDDWSRNPRQTNNQAEDEALNEPWRRSNTSNEKATKEEELDFSNLRVKNTSTNNHNSNNNTNNAPIDVDFGSIRSAPREKLPADNDERPAHLRLRDRLKKLDGRPDTYEKSPSLDRPESLRLESDDKNDSMDANKPGRYVPPNRRPTLDKIPSRADALLSSEPTDNYKATIDNTTRNQSSSTIDNSTKGSIAETPSRISEKPSAVDIKPTLVDTKSNDSKPSIVDSKPSVVDSKASTVDSTEPKKFVPSRKLNQEENVLQPVKLSSIVNTGGSSPSTNTSSGSTIDGKYIPPWQRQTSKVPTEAVKTPKDTKQAAIDRILGKPQITKYSSVQTASAEEDRKRKEIERREKEHLEKLKSIREAELRKRLPFVYENTSVIKEYISSIEDFLKAPSTASIKSLDDEALATLVPALCIFTIMLKYTVEKLPSIEEFNTLFKPIVPVLKNVLSGAGNHIKDHTQHFIKYCIRITHEAGCPKLSSDTSCIEAIFDFLLYQGCVSQSEFIRWLLDYDDSTVGRMQVMFQLTYWGQWLQGELGCREEDDEEEEEEEDSDIEALVPKRAIATRIMRY